MVCFSLSVTAEDIRRRLDVFLSRKLENVSRSSVQRWIEAGHVIVNGVPSKPSYRVRRGDEISVSAPPPEPVNLLAEAIPLHIVYEDSELLVIDKPAGMVVHPGAGNRRGTLANALLYHFEQISPHDPLRPGIVHRLDKGTSGLIVVAKNERAHDFLASQFKRRKVEKRYWALVYGHLPRKTGEIDAPLGRDPWARTRMSTRSRHPRAALTRYELIRWIRGREAFSLVSVLLQTGRTHQIRVHFQHIGHPIVGDQTYAAKAFRKLKDEGVIQAVEKLGRPFLHAAHLSFVHPQTRQRVSFESPLPEGLATLLAVLE